MKKSLHITIAFFLAVLFAPSIISAAAPRNPLGFMMPCNLVKAKSSAKLERKPLLLYIHSTKCYSSRTFTRQIAGKAEFANWAKGNFICMEANVLVGKGKSVAKKYGVLKLPSIIMLSFDTDLEYNVEMKMDSVSLYNQFRSFLSANSLKSQIELMRSTNGLTYQAASKAIAASYAKHDFKKNPAGSPEMMASERTLEIKKLKDLHLAYIDEYKKLVAVSNTNEQKKAVAQN